MCILIILNFTTTTDVKFNGEDYNKGLGSEIDLQFDWAFAKDVKLSAGYSCMLGTKTMDVVKGGNHKSWQDGGTLSDKAKKSLPPNRDHRQQA